MSNNPQIPGADLPLATPGATDTVLGVDESSKGLRRFRRDSFPLSAADQARLQALEAGQSADMLGFATKAAMDASLAYPDGTLALVTNDATAANNGTYRKNGVIGAGSWVLSADRVTGLEGRVVAMEANTVPLIPRKNMIDKTKIIRGEWYDFLNGVLAPGAQYRRTPMIPVKPNTTYTASGIDGTMVKAFFVNPTDTSAISYVTANTFTTPANANYVVINITNDGQYVTTYDDTAQLEVGSAATAYAAYEAIVPQAKIEPITENALTINSGKAYPLRPMSRDGVTSPANAAFNNALLDVRVEGAKPSVYYRLAYFKNGVALGGPQDGWIITECPAGTYATGSSETTVVNFTDSAPNIPRNGLVETVVVTSPVDVDLQFTITLDTSKLPAFGTQIDAWNSGANGRSWIIDPSAYVYRKAGSSKPSGLRVDGDAATKVFKLVFPYGPADMIRLTVQPNGKNGLFNFQRIERAANGPATSASWTTLWTDATDWIPPLQVSAVNNGDAGPIIYTGGNHGSDGSAGGSNTAIMTTWRCEVDGKTLGAAETVGGYAERVTFRWSNNICGYNTITAGRYIVRQDVVMHVTKDGVEVYNDFTALEDVLFRIVNGPQTVDTNFSLSAHFYAGSAQVRQTTVTDSGTKDLAPNAWAVSMGGATGFLNAWLDKAYGYGDGRAVASIYPNIYKSGQKFYFNVVRGGTTAVSAGGVVSWRGGYSWSPASMTSGLDSAFVFRKGKKTNLAFAFTAAGSGTVKLPDGYTGSSVGGAIVGPQGLALSATGYDVQSLPIE